MLGLSGLTGCASVLHQNINEVTMASALSKYKNIDDLIANSPNLKGSKAYYTSLESEPNNPNKWVLSEYKIPVETLRSYCQNIELGTFKHVEKIKTLLPIKIYNEVEGLYVCQKNASTLWGAKVDLSYTYDSHNYKAVRYDVKKISGESYDKKIRDEENERIRRDEEHKKLVERTNAMFQRQKQAYHDELSKLSFITKSTGAGTTICKHHPLEYLYVYNTTATEPYPGKVIIQGVLEKNSGNSTNVQIRLRGAKANHNRIIDLSGKINGSPIKSGELVWDDRKHWYVCS